MQHHAFQRPLRERLFFTACAGASCLWAGALLQAADTTALKNPTIKSSQDISAELDRETNLQAQLTRTLDPITSAIKGTVAGAHRVKRHYPAGTPEYNQARELYAHVRQNMGRLEGELAGAVQTVQQQDRGESAGRVNKQVIVDVNDALQKFDDLVNRVAPAPTPPQPKQPAVSPPPSPVPSSQASPPSELPTPPGLSVEPIQPEQYLQAQPQAGQVSAEVVVQVCDLFVEHTVGLGDRSAENIRGQMIHQIRRQISLPDFGST
jgi:hypothetical protein